MTETNNIELFYSEASLAIRAKQVEYLRKMKAQPFPQDLPEVDELSPGDYAKLGWWQKVSYKRTLRRQRKAYNKSLRRQKRPVDDDLTKGYNAGIEMALSTLEREYNKHVRALAKADD